MVLGSCDASPAATGTKEKDPPRSRWDATTSALKAPSPVFPANSACTTRPESNRIAPWPAFKERTSRPVFLPMETAWVTSVRSMTATEPWRGGPASRRSGLRGRLRIGDARRPKARDATKPQVSVDASHNGGDGQVFREDHIRLSLGGV